MHYNMNSKSESNMDKSRIKDDGQEIEYIQIDELQTYLESEKNKGKTICISVSTGDTSKEKVERDLESISEEELGKVKRVTMNDLVTGYLGKKQHELTGTILFTDEAYLENPTSLTQTSFYNHFHH